MSIFVPDPAQIGCPRRPHGHLPRARRNASKSNACPGRVLHAVTAPPPLLHMCWCSISRWDNLKLSPLPHSLASTPLHSLRLSVSLQLAPPSLSSTDTTIAARYPEQLAWMSIVAGPSSRLSPIVVAWEFGRPQRRFLVDGVAPDPEAGFRLPSGYNKKQLRVPDVKPRLIWIVLLGCGVIHGKSRVPGARSVFLFFSFADFMDELWKCIEIRRKVVK